MEDQYLECLNRKMHIVCAERKSDRAETWKDSEGLEVTPPGWLKQGNVIPSHSHQTGNAL